MIVNCFSSRARTSLEIMQVTCELLELRLY